MPGEVLIPTITMVEGRTFYKKGRFGVANSLDECLKASCSSLYVPEIAEIRIMAAGDDTIWKGFYTTTSIKAMGRGKSTNVSHKGGTKFDVYMHLQNYLSEPKNIRKAVEEPNKGAGILSAKEFQSYLDLEDGERCIVLDHNLSRKWPRDIYGINEPTERHMINGGKVDGKDMIAINNPHIQALFTPKIAEPYLQKCDQLHIDEIGIRHSDDIWRCDDLSGEPFCFLLFLTHNLFSIYDFRYLNGNGCFIGVQGTEGARKDSRPIQVIHA